MRAVLGLMAAPLDADRVEMVNLLLEQVPVRYGSVDIRCALKDGRLMAVESGLGGMTVRVTLSDVRARRRPGVEE